MKETIYFPFQPEIQMTTTGYRELKPADYSKSKDIALFYQFETKKRQKTSLSLIPDGCFDIIFCCATNTPSAFLWTSPVSRLKQPEFIDSCDYFGIRFFPEQSLLKLRYPMKELLNQQIPLADVLLFDPFLIEQISLAVSFGERIKLFKQFIHKSAERSGNGLDLIDYSIKKIYLSGGSLNIKQLSAEIGYSEQYIRRKFEEYIGFSPKQFCKVVQFQNSLSCILKIDHVDVHDVIHENGYYDQPHFIKDFKKLMNVTPKQYKETLAMYSNLP